MIFKGHEELKGMYKSELIDRFKSEIYPDRIKGCVRTENGYSRIINGTNMSNYRPIIGEDEYTWGMLKTYPADMVRIFLYQYLIGNEEEE